MNWKSLQDERLDDIRMCITLLLINPLNLKMLFYECMEILL